MKLRNKVMSANLFIILTILLISGLIIIRTVDNFNLYTVYQYLTAQGDFAQQYLAEYVKLKDDASAALQSDRALLEETLKKQAGCDVQVSGLQLQTPSPLQAAALAGKTAYLISTAGSTRQFQLALPVLARNGTVGTVTFTYSLYQADGMRNSLLLMLVVLYASALAVSLLLSYLFSRRFLRPLEKLHRSTREFSKGNFKEIEGVKTGDEIERLTHSYNEMGQSITRMIGQLKGEQEKQRKLLDNVAHEIRTPLTNILGYADLTGRVADEEQRRKYLSHITSEGNRLLGMVNDLLELSSMNCYEPAVEKVKTDLPALVEQVTELMADKAARFGFHLVRQLEPVEAVVDPAKIKQVLINLIDNAIKYSEGDQIIIRLYQNDLVYLSIHDNGIGIPQQDIPHLAQPFYRVDKSRSRKLGGNGLGLSICREIIAAHGGTLEIKSVENSGTTVTFSLQP